MVTKRIRSEYMKKFKDPKWETYSKCYEEMLKYRLTRRLLEHTHNPWFWSGPDSDSDSAATSPPPPPRKNQVRPETCRGRVEVEVEECEGARLDRQREQPSRANVTVPRLSLPTEEHVSAVHGSQPKGAGETEAPEEEREAQTHSQDRGTVSGGIGPQQTKPSKSSKHARRFRRVRPAPTRQPTDDTKDGRHPFALYGSGEKDADMASRKTHNVGPAASTTEIHESALRAKIRREVERQMQTQPAERQRAKSADTDEAGKVVPPEFNPWVTEYMRCFSARSR
ncbi:centriole, cilia and spindle-associated protein [Pungitius pungitius]|uniref:centriole, cilia and spindle-associated protein n=1 Tax=Pungitius pungitius TaxID=134920 RepID=UPI00188884B5|nr:centriole, cilia and spindle-associated protein [Pungitius pungitius]